jgi:hypothetical protein
MLADAVSVAMGRADGMLATRFTPLEAECAELIVREAGGTTKLLETPAGTVFIAGNVKITRELVALWS